VTRPRVPSIEELPYLDLAGWPSNDPVFRMSIDEPLPQGFTIVRWNELPASDEEVAASSAPEYAGAFDRYIKGCPIKGDAEIIERGRVKVRKIGVMWNEMRHEAQFLVSRSCWEEFAAMAHRLPWPVGFFAYDPHHELVLCQRMDR
jgi:hypothetical protein